MLVGPVVGGQRDGAEGGGAREARLIMLLEQIMLLADSQRPSQNKVFAELLLNTA